MKYTNQLFLIRENEAPKGYIYGQVQEAIDLRASLKTLNKNSTYSFEVCNAEVLIGDTGANTIHTIYQKFTTKTLSYAYEEEQVYEKEIGRKILAYAINFTLKEAQKAAQERFIKYDTSSASNLSVVSMILFTSASLKAEV